MSARAGSITQLETALLGRMGAIRRKTLLPLDLALACTINRRAAQDTPLPVAIVSISTGRLIHRLYAEQEVALP